MPSIGELVSEQVGPLPVWGWLAAIGAGIGVSIFLDSRTGGPPADADPSSLVDEQLAGTVPIVDRAALDGPSAPTINVILQGVTPSDDVDEPAPADDDVTPPPDDDVDEEPTLLDPARTGQEEDLVEWYMVTFHWTSERGGAHGARSTSTYSHAVAMCQARRSMTEAAARLGVTEPEIIPGSVDRDTQLVTREQWLARRHHERDDPCR